MSITQNKERIFSRNYEVPKYIQINKKDGDQIIMQQTSSTSKRYFKIETDKILLLPYLKEMVPKYHGWMQDPEMLELTASEPLTLEEEYENQISWLADKTKYTFIVFLKQQDKKYLDEGIISDLCLGAKMVGDVNFFMHPYLEENEAEIDIMIAEPDARRGGVATQAVKAMINFGVKEYKKNKILAKIKQENIPSINLFEKLGFKKFKELPAFGEVHYELDIDPEIIKNEQNVFPDLNENAQQLTLNS